MPHSHHAPVAIKRVCHAPAPYFKQTRPIPDECAAQARWDLAFDLHQQHSAPCLKGRELHVRVFCVLSHSAPCHGAHGQHGVMHGVVGLQGKGSVLSMRTHKVHKSHPNT